MTIARAVHNILRYATPLPTRLRRADTMYMSSTARSSAVLPAPAGAVWTVADLDQFPRDGRRYEVLHGELLVTPMPSVAHQWGATQLVRRFADWCDAHTGWAYFTPGGVFISATTWLEPDLAVYPVPISPELTWRNMPPPVLVVEVLSRSTRRRDRYRKRPAYLAHGVSEVWLLDQADRTVERWTSASEFPELHRDGITWTPVESAPPLVLSREMLFGMREA